MASHLLCHPDDVAARVAAGRGWEIRLENRTTRHAFWIASAVDGHPGHATIRWGRIGSRGQRRAGSLTWTEAVARASEKLGGGYLLISARRPSVSARRPEPPATARPIEDRVAGSTFMPVEMGELVRRLARGRWSEPSQLSEDFRRRLWPHGGCESLNVYREEASDEPRLWAVARFENGSRLLAQIID